MEVLPTQTINLQSERIMQLNSYLSFNGDCEAAFKFYEQALGAKTEMLLTYGGSPMASQTPAELQNKIMHGRLSIDGQTLMGSDALCGRYEQPKGVWISLGITDPAEADRVFAALLENGRAVMPIGETFWALRFGMLIDQFGIPWMINCEKPA
jgi:PhnB protein